MLITLLSTLLLAIYLISDSHKKNPYFLDLQFLIIYPPLAGLIYFEILSKLNINIAEYKIIEPVLKEFSQIYIVIIIFFISIFYLIKKISPPFGIVKNIELPSFNLSLKLYFLVKIINFFMDSLNSPISLSLLIGEISHLSLILLFCSTLENLKLNKSFFKFSLFSLSLILIVFLFTFDKGGILTLLVSVFVVLLGTNKMQFQIKPLKTFFIYLGFSFFLPFLNFIEDYFFMSDRNPVTFGHLTSIMETAIITNFYHIFYDPFCNYNNFISIFQVISSPIKALLGSKLNIHQNAFMEACFPVEKAAGAGRAFGLISESLMSKEIPYYIYFSLFAIGFILIFEYLYFRFSLIGILIYSQSIEHIYKLTRSDTISVLFAILYSIIAAFIVRFLLSIIDSSYNSKIKVLKN